MTSNIRSSPRELPLHERILRDMEEEILSGRLSPGDTIPSEADLMAKYGCSRMTVYKAMSTLSSRGLITRKRGFGSVVSKPQVEHAVLEIHDFIKEAERSGHLYEYELLSREISAITPAEARRLQLPGKMRIMRLKCLHRINNLPIAIESRLINLFAVPQAAEESFDAIPPGTWLLQKVPWTVAEHSIRAISADRNTARLLELAPSAACLVLNRVTWHLGVPVTDVQLTHAGERYQLVGTLQPASSSGFGQEPARRLAVRR
jgi:GntR family histidine utilization transcriptional repressor